MKNKSLLLLTLVVTLSFAMVGCSSQGKDSKGEESSQEQTKNTSVEEVISIVGENYEIPGIFTMPSNVDKNEKVPAVLLLHGTGGNKNELADIYKRVAEELAANGYASLRIDFTGGGDSKVPYVENNLDYSVDDAMKSIEYLASNDKIDADRIGVLGYSQGGRVAQIVAARNEKVKAIATWASASSNGAENFEGFLEYEEEALKNGSVTITMPWGTELETGKKFFEAIRASHAMDEIANYTGPLLAINGSEDPLVPPIQSRKLVMNAGSTDATLRIIEGVDHSFGLLDENSDGPAELMETTVEWFKAKL